MASALIRISFLVPEQDCLIGGTDATKLGSVSTCGLFRELETLARQFKGFAWKVEQARVLSDEQAKLPIDVFRLNAHDFLELFYDRVKTGRIPRDDTDQELQSD